MAAQQESIAIDESRTARLTLQAMTRQLQEFLIDSTEALSRSADSWQPLGFIDLETCPEELAIKTLPPFPVIGLGDPAHGLASALDAVVEPPVSAEMLIHQVERTPHAAAAAVQLLRSIDGLPSERALLLESICYGLLQGSAEHAAWLASCAPKTQPSPPGEIVLERRDHVLRIVLDRPWARNAISYVMRDRLLEAFTLALLDPQVRAIKLRATGTTFCAGGDLKEFGTTTDPAMAHLIRSRTLPALAVADCAKILDVHAQGACIGAGLEIAAFAARFTASSDASFQLPELAMGLIPGAGGCVSAPRRIGRQRTVLMILSGCRINAEIALRWGLIDAVEN
jgi:hypothetical protein